MALDESASAAGDGDLGIRGEIRLHGRSVLQWDRGYHAPKSVVHLRLLRPPSCFVEMLVGRHIDLNEDNLFDLYPGRESGKVCHQVRLVERWNILHPVVSQIPRIVEMNVAVDDGKVWQFCISLQCSLVRNGSVGPQQSFMLELRPDAGRDFGAHEG